MLDETKLLSMIEALQSSDKKLRIAVDRVPSALETGDDALDRRRIAAIEREPVRTPDFDDPPGRQRAGGVLYTRCGTANSLRFIR